MSEEHPFARLTAFNRDAFAERNQQSYESGRLQKLLTTLVRDAGRASSLVKKLCRAEQNRSGVYRLSFRAFNEEFEGFPYVLGADPLDGHKLHINPKATIPAFFERFLEAPLASAFDAFEETQVRGERGCGLIFRRKGIRQGLVILDDVVDLPSAYQGLYWTFRDGDFNVLRIASYLHFLFALRDGGVSLG